MDISYQIPTGHSITLFNITHVHVVEFNNGGPHGFAMFIFEVKFYWWLEQVSQ
jgi:hypothetical protein